MNLGLSGKVAIILGSSRGLGAGIAASMAAEGVHIFLVARNEFNLKETSIQINKKYGVKCNYLSFNLTNVDELGEIVSACRSELGDPEIIVNITGGPNLGCVTDVSLHDWREGFSMMFFPLVELSKYYIPYMKEKGWGRIITVIGASAVQPVKDLAVSGVVRASILNWNKILSCELAKFGITSNVVIAGRIETERVRELDHKRALENKEAVEQVIDASVKKIPLARYGTVVEFSSTVTFLASSQAGYITGSAIRVDGGLIQSML